MRSIFMHCGIFLARLQLIFKKRWQNLPISTGLPKVCFMFSLHNVNCMQKEHILQITDINKYRQINVAQNYIHVLTKLAILAKVGLLSLLLGMW